MQLSNESKVQKVGKWPKIALEISRTVTVTRHIIRFNKSVCQKKLKIIRDSIFEFFYNIYDSSAYTAV